MIINIAEDYSDAVGERYISGGSFSGEDFRDNFLEPRYLQCLYEQDTLLVNFDGGYGYSPGFLEEVFGGMVRKGYTFEELMSVMKFISNDDTSLISDIIQYMSDQEARMLKDK